MLDLLPLGQPVPCRSSDGSEALDLNALLVPHPISTFYMRVAGNELRRCGVLDGDLLVIDRSIEPQPGHLVVVAYRGQFLLRPLLREQDHWWLAPLQPGERPIPVEIDDIQASPLFGVAVHGVHRLGPAASRRH